MLLSLLSDGRRLILPSICVKYGDAQILEDAKIGGFLPW